MIRELSNWLIMNRLTTQIYWSVYYRGALSDIVNVIGACKDRKLKVHYYDMQNYCVSILAVFYWE